MPTSPVPSDPIAATGPTARAARRGRDGRSWPRSPARAGGLRVGLATLVALVLPAPACDDGNQAPSIPPAEAYDQPSDFAGEWIGEVDGQVGTLTITPLGTGRYRGLYEGEDVKLEYVLLLEQTLVPAGSSSIAANRATFTWQDGHGSRGEGWLLINREDSALTGAFGERGQLDRSWTFIRVE